MPQTKLTLLLVLSTLYWAAVSRTAGQVVKRSDDTDPLSVVVSTLSQDVAALRAELQAAKTELQTTRDSIQTDLQNIHNSMARKAAFQGTMTTATPTPNAPIHLTTISQTGTGYDATSGIYVAPFSGWYAVDYQMFPGHQLQGTFDVDLHQNGNIVARARCVDPIEYGATCTAGVTVHAAAGDKFWIQTSQATVEFWTSPFDNFFSVALVFADN